MASNSRIQLETWLKTIDVKGSVLDIGGSQNPIKGRTKSWDVSDYKIIDLEQPHECKQEPDIVGDIQDIVDYDTCDDILLPWGYRKYKKFFDNIFCIEVSEYWFDPLQALKNINILLKKYGLLYISFHYQYMIHGPKGLDYLRYTPDGAEKLLKESGFEIIEHKLRETESPHLTSFYAEDKMRGLKGYNHNVTGSLIKAKKM